LIGKEHCRALAHAGATVIVADLNLEACVEFASTLPNGAVGLSFGITSEMEVMAAAAWVDSKFSGVDILVNNAAINDHFQTDADILSISSFENYPVDMFEKSWEVNVKGMFLCSQKFGQLMVKKEKEVSLI